MSVYRIHRLKESARQQFRWAPHTIGVSHVKPKDYEPAFSMEAGTPYAVWMQLKDTPDALEIGDILESEMNELRIYKYVGFEEAQWVLPEVKVSGPEVSGNNAASQESPSTAAPAV